MLQHRHSPYGSRVATLGLTLAVSALVLTSVLALLYLRTDRRRRAELACLRAQVADATAAEAIIARATATPEAQADHHTHLRLIKGGGAVAIPAVAATVIWLWRTLRAHTAMPTASLAAFALAAIAAPMAQPHTADLVPPVVVRPADTPAPKPAPSTATRPAPRPAGIAPDASPAPTSPPPTAKPSPAPQPASPPAEDADDDGLCLRVRLPGLGSEVCVGD